MNHMIRLFCLTLGWCSLSLYGLSLYSLSVQASAAVIENTAYTKDVTLPEREIVVLEEMVCLKPHNLKADSVQGYKDVESKVAFDSAFVQCQTHGEFRGKPMHYQAGCTFTNRQWQCNQDGFEIVVNVNGKDVKMHPWGISPEAAYQILVKISTYGTFQSVTMDDAIGSSCYISPSKDQDIVELNCQSIITVSLFCPQPQITNCPRVVYVSKPLL